MLSKIDELTRSDHFYLEPADDCFFLREYTAPRSYQFSETNQLILNLKKSVDRRGRPEWMHKSARFSRWRASCTNLSTQTG